ATTLSSSPRIGSRKRPRGFVSTTRQRLAAELLIQVHRISDANPARRADRREYADVGAMVKRSRAQDRVVAREVFLRMRRHHAAQCGLHRNNPHAVADFERTA